MAFATMNASPPRTCRMRNAPPGKEKHSRMRNAPPGKEKPHAKCSLFGGISDELLHQAVDMLNKDFGGFKAQM